MANKSGEFSGWETTLGMLRSGDHAHWNTLKLTHNIRIINNTRIILGFRSGSYSRKKGLASKELLGIK